MPESYESPAPNGDRALSDLRWWRCPKGEIANTLWTAFDTAREHDAGRADAYRRLRSLYEVGLLGADGDGAGVDGFATEVSRDNFVASVIDTAGSKLLEQRPAPMAQTAGGDMLLRRQAELLTEWTKEACEQIGVYTEVEACWTDAMICGSGAVRVFERSGGPACEVAFCEDIFVDPKEARNHAVMTYYQVRVMDRAVVAEVYPDHKTAIMEASASSDEHHAEDYASDSSTADMVTVVLAWRVAPSGGTPGKHAVVLHGGPENLLLLCEDYQSTEGPFVFFHWRTRPRKFWGTGLASMLAPIQAEIDNLGDIIDQTLESFVPQVWVEEGTVKIKEIDDETGCYYTYSGSRPPTFFDPSGTAAQGQRQWQETRMQRGYHLAGVSSAEAGAQKEAGLDSGKALRVHQDIKSQRLLRQHRNIEDGYREVFRRLIEVADQIVAGVDADGEKTTSTAKKDDRMRYLVGDGDELEELSYHDVRIKDAMFKIEIFPISKLADSPAGRSQQVTEWMNVGLIQGDEALDIMDFPDLKSVVSMRTAGQKWAKTVVEKAVHNKAGPNDVTSLDDHATMVQHGTILHSRARIEGATVDSLENLRQTLARATAYMAKAAAAAAPPPMPAGPAGPPAGPGGPPGGMPPGPPM